MDQAKIMTLLQEASELGQEAARGKFDDSQWISPQAQRLARIQVELGRALTPTAAGETRVLLEGLLGQIFCDTLDKKPEYLPALFPAFAVLCGDHTTDTWHCSEIDWSLLK